MGGDGDWCSVSEAARRIGVTRAAIQNRIRRHTLDTMTDNHGRPLVRVAVAGGATVYAATLRKVAGDTVALEPPHPAASVPDMIPMSSHRSEIDRLQQAHSAALAATQEQVEHLRAAIVRADAQAAHHLAERDALHLDAIGRMQAQAGVERSLWLERVDAAELRAERVEQRLDQVLDVLLTERRPWWSRWFGQSKRSDIG